MWSSAQCRSPGELAADVTLTGRAAAAALAGIGVIVIFRVLAALVAVNAAILTMIAIDLLLAAPVTALRFTRTGDATVLLGGTARVQLEVRNTGRRTLRAGVRDAWRPSAGASPHSVSMRVPAGGRASMTTSLTPQRRGDMQAAVVTVRSRGPFGLASRQRSRHVPWTIRVLPAFPSRRHLPAKLSQLRQLDGQHRTLLRGPGSEFDSLREYVTGDDVRSIDWRATARRGDVTVRTWRPERDRRILMLLDTGRTSAGRVQGIPRLDASMDAVLLLTALATRAGDRVDFLAFDRQVRARVVGAQRPAVLAAVTNAMALIEPSLVETDAAALASVALTTTRGRSLLVLLTDLNPAALEQGLLPRLPLLTTRNRVLIGAVADPAVDEMAAGRGRADDVYDAAAAELARSERRRISMILQRSGAQVVDAPPAKLPGELADAYHSLKAAGRL
jgi:uncharacterized protein (DUF58 family)